MFGGSGYGEGGGYGEGMGGGGFTQGGGFTSPGGGGDKQKKFRSQSILPLTVAHINALTHDGMTFNLGEIEVGQVTLVGIVTHVDKSQTSVTYMVDDTTAGPVTIKHWYSMEDGEEGQGEEQMIYNEGTYVRVFAQVRSFQGKVTLSALKMYPIEDMNELTTHILECIHFQMSANKKKKTTPRDNQPMATSSGAGTSTNMGIDNVQNQVFDLIKNCQDEEGLGIDVIRAKLRGLNATQIKNSLEFLSNEGHIYSTIDEEHFKSTG